MKKLNEINSDIQQSKMRPEQKQNIKTIIDNATHHFNQYSNYIDSIETTISNKIK
jgi:hypothetical protein